MSFLVIPAIAGARYLALPSGGARGITTPGGLQAFKELCGIDFGIDLFPANANNTNNTNNTNTHATAAHAKHERLLLGVSGTSIGAMQALMIAVGYSVEELWRQTSDARFSDFVRLDPTQLTSAHALDSGITLRTTISNMLHKKLGVRDMTLFQLRQHTGVDLVVVAADATTATVRYLRADTEPTMSVVQAVYASMALAPLLPPLEYRGHLLQDGGGMDAIPTCVWDDKPEPTLSFALHWTRDTSPSSFSACDTNTDAEDKDNEEGKGNKGDKADKGDKGDKGDKEDKESKKSGNVIAYLARTLYCALYPSKVVQWCLMPARMRATCIVLDTSDIATVDLHLSEEMKERSRSKGYQDTAAALFLMSSGKPPHRGAQRFAKADGLPLYIHALLDAAHKADQEYASGEHVQHHVQSEKQGCAFAFRGLACGACPECLASSVTT